MIEKTREPKKTIRYFRWSVKAIFLLIFMIPVVYLAKAATAEPVYSLLFGGLSKPLLTVPLGESPCSIFLVYYGYIGPGAWLVCPIGGLQTLLTSRVNLIHLLPLILALFLFLIPIFILGNVFCSWVCPLGTAIDSFDKGVEKWMPKTNMKREERRQRNKEKQRAKKTGQTTASQLNNAALCPACPFGRALSNVNNKIANGVVVSALVGSAIFKFPVFCTICPIGISTRGMFHLKSVFYIKATLTNTAGTLYTIIAELWAIPAIAILASLREKRYWCRKLCPVGATLNVAGSFSPLLKPTVKPDKCIMNGCPKDCEDYHLNYCSACRQADQKQCEKVCPVDINLCEGESSFRCTKCMECYITCQKNAVEIKITAKPEALTAITNLLKKRRKNTILNPSS